VASQGMLSLDWPGGDGMGQLLMASNQIQTAACLAPRSLLTVKNLCYVNVPFQVDSSFSKVVLKLPTDCLVQLILIYLL